MFARVTQLEIDVVRTSVAEAARRFEAEVLPELRRRPGFRGSAVLATADGLGTVITFWDREEQAAPDEAYEAVLSRYVTLFGAPPGREVYEVLAAEVPPVGAGAPS